MKNAPPGAPDYANMRPPDFDDIARTRAAMAPAPQVSIQNLSGQAFFLGRVDAGELPDLIDKLRRNPG